MNEKRLVKSPESPKPELSGRQGSGAEEGGRLNIQICWDCGHDSPGHYVFCAHYKRDGEFLNDKKYLSELGKHLEILKPAVERDRAVISISGSLLDDDEKLRFRYREKWLGMLEEKIKEIADKIFEEETLTRLEKEASEYKEKNICKECGHKLPGHYLGCTKDSLSRDMKAAEIEQRLRARISAMLAGEERSEAEAWLIKFSRKNDLSGFSSDTFQFDEKAARREEEAARKRRAEQEAIFGKEVGSKNETVGEVILPPHLLQAEKIVCENIFNIYSFTADLKTKSKRGALWEALLESKEKKKLLGLKTIEVHKHVDGFVSGVVNAFLKSLNDSYYFFPDQYGQMERRKLGPTEREDIKKYLSEKIGQEIAEKFERKNCNDPQGAKIISLIIRGYLSGENITAEDIEKSKKEIAEKIIEILQPKNVD